MPRYAAAYTGFTAATESATPIPIQLSIPQGLVKCYPLPSARGGFPQLDDLGKKFRVPAFCNAVRPERFVIQGTGRSFLLNLRGLREHTLRLLKASVSEPAEAKQQIQRTILCAVRGTYTELLEVLEAKPSELLEGSEAGEKKAGPANPSELLEEFLAHNFFVLLLEAEAEAGVSGPGCSLAEICPLAKEKDPESNAFSKAVSRFHPAASASPVIRRDLPDRLITAAAPAVTAPTPDTTGDVLSAPAPPQPVPQSAVRSLPAAGPQPRREAAPETLHAIADDMSIVRTVEIHSHSNWAEESEGSYLMEETEFSTENLFGLLRPTVLC